MKAVTLCSKTADYSKVAGEKILPFVFALNEEDSLLNPGEGEHQKFCYDVVGVGQNNPKQVNLSHFVLGICEEIKKEDILSVTVVVNGLPKEIRWGDNVELVTEKHSGQEEECAGLKFEFALDKMNGEMQVCFTLAQKYNIGPVAVCASGANITATGLTICGPVCGGLPSCESTFYQTETVCVPVTVKPFAKSKGATARCCGTTVVAKQDSCPKGKTVCTFTVTQPLCIEVPIEFGADIITGEASVICGDISEEGCNCGDTAEVEEEDTVDYNNFNRRKRFFE